MMRNLFLSTAAAMIAFAAPALADDLAIKPYVGADLQRWSYDYNDDYEGVDGNKVLSGGLNGGNVHVGARIGKYFGTELGYFRTQNKSKNIAAGDSVGPGLIATTDLTTKIRTQGFSLDGLGYLPVTEDEKLELIGTAGITWTKAEVDASASGESADDDESELGFRVGGGAQYSLTDSLSVRGLARYQTADFSLEADDVAAEADHAWTYSLGVNYSF